MKKYSLPLVIVCISLFTYCNPARKAAAVAAPTVFYDTEVKSLVETKCTPCHIPSKGGRKEAFDTYDAVKAHIDDVIRRIELNPSDPGFMPFKHPKLTESEINVFKTWRAEGMTKSK